MTVYDIKSFHGINFQILSQITSRLIKKNHAYIPSHTTRIITLHYNISHQWLKLFMNGGFGRECKYVRHYSEMLSVSTSWVLIAMMEEQQYQTLWAKYICTNLTSNETFSLAIVVILTDDAYTENLLYDVKIF